MEKPGIRTTEFWLSIVVTVLGAVAAQGGDSVEVKVAGLVLAGLAAFGYAQARGKAKGR
jgi:hypothetical protein